MLAYMTIDAHANMLTKWQFTCKALMACKILVAHASAHCELCQSEMLCTHPRNAVLNMHRHCALPYMPCSPGFADQSVLEQFCCLKNTSKIPRRTQATTQGYMHSILLIACLHFCGPFVWACWRRFSLITRSQFYSFARQWAHESSEWLSESTKVITNLSQRLSMRK